MNIVSTTSPFNDRKGPGAALRQSTWLFLVPAALLLVMACSGGGSGGGTTNVAPAITTQPLDQTVNASAAASFTVAASGTPAPTYTWERSNDSGTTWAAVSGATSATYTFTTIKADNSAQFRAIATNTVNPAATSSAATLSVRWLEITAQPQGQSVFSGATTATFAITVDANPAPTFQWQSSLDGITWVDISGATAISYAKTGNDVGEDGTQFRCVATNPVGSLTSDPATLNVNAAPTAPVFTTHPATQTIGANLGITFTAAATGVPSPTFTWERSNDSGTTWAVVTGANSATYTFTAILTDNGAQFRALATNTVSTTTSSAATLTVTPATLTIAVPDSLGGAAVDLVLEPIPAGSFNMGATEVTPGAYPQGESIHPVTFAEPFYMAKFECTQALWQAVMNANQAGFNPIDYPDPNALSRPVETVSYNDITTATTGFLDQLNAATASSRPAGMAFRLPTEAEWEYACRAGSTSNFFYGTDDQGTPVTLDTYAWFGSGVITQPVGGKSANAWGLHDMAGNIFEICLDDYHVSYDATGAAIPVRPDDGTAWLDNPRAATVVARGGSFNLPSHYCQSHERGQLTPGAIDTDDGFRVVLALIP